jgi:hypothetical protein
MNITLLPHQVIGLAWMLDKEQGADKGGIMADEMGLGKVSHYSTSELYLLDKIIYASNADCAANGIDGEEPFRSQGEEDYPPSLARVTA